MAKTKVKTGDKKTKPVSKATPASKTKAASKAKPENKTKAVGKAKPANKTKAVGKAKPANKTKAASKAKPANITKAADKAKPANKTKAASKAKSAKIDFVGKSAALTKSKHIKNQSIVKSAYIALALAWIFAILPIPVLSYLGFVISNLTAMILGVVSLTKDEIKTGVIVLVGAIVGSPIMYLLGWVIFGLLMA